MAQTIAESRRNVGIGLIVGGAVAGGLSALLFWLATQDHMNIGLIAFGSITALLAVFLIGYGIQKVATAGSAT